jgi:D-alanine-D-alanine ligase
MRKVAVFFGGRSCENEISVLTGVFVMNVLEGERYSVLPVYVHTDGKMYTSEKMKNVEVFKEKKYSEFQRIFFDGATVYALNTAKRKIKRLCSVDVALNCCHGGLGEGGGVSALAEWNGIPLASPDLTSSGVFMDKSMTKLVMRALNVPTVDYIRVNEGDYQKRGAFLLKSIEGRLKYPVVIKPAHLGSSIGICLAANEVEAKTAIEAAFALDNRVIIEKYLPQKQDVNCAAYSLNGDIYVSEPEVAFGGGIYSFEDKYVKRKTDHGQPILSKGGGRYALNAVLREKIRSYTKTIYKRMNLKGVVRMDFLVSDERAYLCEVNTVPGSLAYYLFCERIIDAKAFFFDLLEDAIREGGEQKKLLSTGILKTAKTRK